VPLDATTVAGHAATTWAEEIVPSRALIVSMQMSGALKYYTKWPIVRWDRIPPERFPELRRMAEERGLRWYALFWPSEEAGFFKNLPGSGRASAPGGT